MTAPAKYHFVEVAPVTADTLATAVNEAVAEGWLLDGIRFVVTEASRRPSMAFVSFVAADERLAPRVGAPSGLARDGGGPGDGPSR